MEAGIECYYPPERKRKPITKLNDVAQDDELDEQATAAEPADAEPADAEPFAAEPAATQLAASPAADVTGPAAMPESAPEPIHEDETSDLGSPGFNSSHPEPSELVPQQTDAPTFPEVSNELYQPGTGGLSYPQAVPDDMAAGMDYSAYSNQLGQQQASPSGMAYPQHSQQTSNTYYPDPLSAPSAPGSEPVQPVQASTQPTRPKSSSSGARHSLPSGASSNNNVYSSTSSTGNGSTLQAANVPSTTSQTYTSSSPPLQPRAGRPKAAPLLPRVFEASQHENLVPAGTLAQGAMQKTQPSPTARTMSPFKNPTQAAAQAARAKSRQGQRTQGRATASPFQQASSAQAAAVAPAPIYNQSTSTDPNNNIPNYDQYSQYHTATTQGGQATSRSGYDAYSHQSHSNNLSASYPAYDAYSARSQSSTASPLAAPVTQGMSASYTKTTAPSTSSWSNGTGHRSTNSYGANNAATSTKSTYNAPASSTQQQPANMPSYNMRPQSHAHASRTSTPTSYSAQQQHTQQPRQQHQQNYSSYAASSHSSTGQQSSQQQQDWYGFNSSNNANIGYGSNSRSTEFGQPSQHRPAAMNISGNTYQSMNDQELYDILRGPPAQ